MSRLKKYMALRCEHCPLCIYARKNPETMAGKVIHWHGKWCPFWKAWEDEYGKKSFADPASKAQE